VSGTAAIEFLTGLPGSGKSLRMVKRIREELAKGRLVYVCNLAGLKMAGVQPWDDPREWKKLPPGSILFVDEAQKFFRARRSGEPPECILDMETIRHDGITLVLATQQPSYIDSHIRGLCGRHEHLLRKDGAQRSYVFRSNEIMDDPKALRARLKADTETMRFEQADFDCYESAEIHTMKYSMPQRVKRGIMLVSFILFALGGAGMLAFKTLAHDRDEPNKATAGPALAQPTSGRRSPDGKEETPMTKDEYLRQQTPRVANQPWSAPVFDGHSAAADPRIICASTVDTCTCMTEQATLYLTELDDCRFIARWGSAYNPFKPADQVAPPQVQPAAPITNAEAETLATLQSQAQ
jgi:zona occludens toxin